MASGAGRRKAKRKVSSREATASHGAAVDRFDPARFLLERTGFLSDEQLASLIEKATSGPLPAWLTEYIAGRLRRTIKYRKGRHRISPAKIDFLLADIVDRFFEKRDEYAKIPLRKRPRGKAGKPKSFSLLAAEDFVHEVDELRKRNISPRRLLNLISQYGWTRRGKRK